MSNQNSIKLNLDLFVREVQDKMNGHVEELNIAVFISVFLKFEIMTERSSSEIFVHIIFWVHA